MPVEERLRKKRPEIKSYFRTLFKPFAAFAVGEIIGEAVREHKIVPKEKYDEVYL